MSGKLTTPINFEDELQPFNEVRPFKLKAEVKGVVSLPALTPKELVGGEGKHLQLLQSADQNNRVAKTRRLTGYEFKAETKPGIITDVYICLFLHKVEGVMMFITELVPGGYIAWRSWIGAIELIQYTTVGCYWIPFRGVDLRMKFHVPAVGNQTAHFYGFY